ncbi:BnaC06g05300D [Brassica napus]|uniref:BnaC06g05300D protein n=1 Tax=Brassica napus TaxID=3708 RepID=A0A078HS96_BRANA|nr:BnaC06g05300D [Brassica napus]
MNPARRRTFIASSDSRTANRRYVDTHIPLFSYAPIRHLAEGPNGRESPMPHCFYTLIDDTFFFFYSRYEDYLRQESLLIGADETPDFAEENAVRRKTLFVANLSHDNNELLISNISKIFKDVVEVVRLRLIVDHCGEHVSCGFVEFASANEAQKAMMKNSVYL